MKVTSQLSEIRSHRWSDASSTWGLVPTMGALHKGHISLFKRARQENDKVAVSLFVNPIQFNNPDDLENYPVVLDEDLKILKEENVDLVWTPGTVDIYPPDFQTYIQVEHISTPLEGNTRPGHFKGVVTVVAILFNTFQPHRAYFGQKDAQQLLVIKQMAKDLKFNLDIISCPTIRENDGLAVSSRNRNLNTDDRNQAICLFRALTEAKRSILGGNKDTKKIKASMMEIINCYSLARVDYISIASPLTLEEVDTITTSALISLAVFIGKTRLIDNMTIDI